MVMVADAATTVVPLVSHVIADGAIGVFWAMSLGSSPLV
jgi:hypothetical protein